MPGFIISSVLLGIGLAMDAFSVSVADGLSLPEMPGRLRLMIPLTFAGFQFTMPLVGWLCVRSVAETFLSFQRAIPWIALILLSIIGVRMVTEGLRGGDEAVGDMALSPGVLITQGLATSIDALSAGFTLAKLDMTRAAAACGIVSGVTYLLSFCGLHMGRRVGSRLSGPASVLGGLILLGIGLEIFLGGP